MGESIAIAIIVTCYQICDAGLYAMTKKYTEDHGGPYYDIVNSSLAIKFHVSIFKFPNIILSI